MNLKVLHVMQLNYYSTATPYETHTVYFLSYIYNSSEKSCNKTTRF